MRTLVRWDESFSTEETNELLKRLASEILRDVPECADRQRIAAGIASSDYRLLCNTDLTYQELSASSAISLRQCLAFFSKRVDLDIGVDRREVALAKWFDAERACSETNDIFNAWSRGKFQFSPRVESVLFQAQRKIASIVGDAPSLADIKLRFGPGATTKVKKRNASPREKLGAGFSCSEDLLPILTNVLEEMPEWSGLSRDGPDSVQATVALEHCRLDFVPKNAKTDRGIAVEPVLNSMVQNGLGAVLQHRLLRSGVDLQDQSKNQRLALQGSLTGALATLDLSSASDTISRELVFHLLPIDWAVALDLCRSSQIEYGPVSLNQQKFSSMGNGFTFPLESLIFFALAYSSCLEALGRPPKADEISVYGDDIIVPAEAYDLLSEILRICGFSVNHAKSFSSGPFRESCGKDYLLGIDIRPCYIKDKMDGSALFVLHNFFKRAYRDDLCNILRSYLHSSLCIFGPDGYGDGHLLGEWVPKPVRRVAEKPFPPTCSTSRPPSDWRSPKYSGGYGGYTFDTFTFKSRRSFRPSSGDCILPSYSIYVSDPQGRMRDLDTLPLYKRGFLRSAHTPVRCQVGSDGGALQYDKDGRLGVTLPGRKGYKRISIYTLNPL